MDERHWSKDFVEHIRSVHFALVAVCVGLLVLTSFPGESVLKRAHQQVRQMLDVTNAWNEGFVQEAASALVGRVEARDKRALSASIGNFQQGDIFAIRSKDNVVWAKPVFSDPY
jgi:hypothetical protein